MYVCASRLRLAADFWLCCYIVVYEVFVGATSSVQVTPSGLDLAVEHPSRKWMPSNLPVDIIDNYKEAVISFSKVCQYCNYVMHSTCCIISDWRLS